MSRQSAEHLLQSWSHKNPFVPSPHLSLSGAGAFATLASSLVWSLAWSRKYQNVFKMPRCFVFFFLKNKLMRVENSSVSLDYNINPAISRFSGGFLLVLTWANSEHSPLEPWTQGQFILFNGAASVLLHCLTQTLHECPSPFGCPCWAVLPLKSQERPDAPWQFSLDCN